MWFIAETGATGGASVLVFLGSLDVLTDFKYVVTPYRVTHMIIEGKQQNLETIIY